LPTYVRRRDDETWHWCTNCPDYPEWYEIAERQTFLTDERPIDGELHNECKAIEETGRCRPAEAHVSGSTSDRSAPTRPGA
jgi:hypothetical protein